MEISAIYCEKCGLLSTHWVIHQGELFECSCGSLNAKCVGHYFDTTFYGSKKASERVVSAQGEKLVSIKQDQISQEFLEILCQQFGFFVNQTTLHQIIMNYGEDKYFAGKELRNAIMWDLISKLDKSAFHHQLTKFRKVQGLIDFIRDCYVEPRERFLFTEDFSTALKEYKKGYRIIVSDEAGVMGHGGISENFEPMDVAEQKEAVEELTKFCRQHKSKYYYYVDYLSNTK